MEELAAKLKDLESANRYIVVLMFISFIASFGLFSFSDRAITNEMNADNWLIDSRPSHDIKTYWKRLSRNRMRV